MQINAYNKKPNSMAVVPLDLIFILKKERNTEAVGDLDKKQLVSVPTHVPMLGICTDGTSKLHFMQLIAHRASRNTALFQTTSRAPSIPTSRQQYRYSFFGGSEIQFKSANITVVVDRPMGLRIHVFLILLFTLSSSVHHHPQSIPWHSRRYRYNNNNDEG